MDLSAWHFPLSAQTLHVRWHFLFSFVPTTGNPVGKMISTHKSALESFYDCCQFSPHFGNMSSCHFFQKFLESEFLWALLLVHNVCIHKGKLEEVEKIFLPPLHLFI
jgi:hypothetical protein